MAHHLRMDVASLKQVQSNTNQPMKLLLLPIAASFLLPATAMAAPGKLFGGFAPKKKIVLVVVGRESTRTQGTTVNNNARIPSGIPNFSIGDNVTMKIGARGALLVDEFKIPFRRETESTNYYANRPPSEGAKGNAATLEKSSNGRNAIAGEITFYTYRTKGLVVTTNRVTYELAK
jgi:hypothetical protein